MTPSETISPDSSATSTSVCGGVRIRQERQAIWDNRSTLSCPRPRHTSRHSTQADRRYGVVHEGLSSLLTIWQTLTEKEMNRPMRTGTPGGV